MLRRSGHVVSTSPALGDRRRPRYVSDSPQLADTLSAMFWLAAVKKASAKPGSVLGADTRSRWPRGDGSGLFDVEVGLAGSRRVPRRTGSAVDVLDRDRAPRAGHVARCAARNTAGRRGRAAASVTMPIVSAPTRVVTFERAQSVVGFEIRRADCRRRGSPTRATTGVRVFPFPASVTLVSVWTATLENEA